MAVMKKMGGNVWCPTMPNSSGRRCLDQGVDTKKMGLEQKNVSTVKELVVYCKNAVFTVNVMHKKCPFKRTIRKEHFYIHTLIHALM